VDFTATVAGVIVQPIEIIAVFGWVIKTGLAIIAVLNQVNGHIQQYNTGSLWHYYSSMNNDRILRE
jgi:hypothetical protein